MNIEENDMVRPAAVVAPGLSAGLSVCGDLWSDGEDLARHARQFMTGHLTAVAA